MRSARLLCRARCRPSSGICLRACRSLWRSGWHIWESRILQSGPAPALARPSGSKSVCRHTIPPACTPLNFMASPSMVSRHSPFSPPSSSPTQVPCSFDSSLLGVEAHPAVSIMPNATAAAKVKFFLMFQVLSVSVFPVTWEFDHPARFCSREIFDFARSSAHASAMICNTARRLVPSVLPPFHPPSSIFHPRSLRPSRAATLALLFLAALTARADWPEFRGPWGNGHASAPGDTKPIGLPLPGARRTTSNGRRRSPTAAGPPRW